MSNIREILSKKPPEKLFHYTSQSGLLGIIRSKSIWATQQSYFNDAKEFHYAIGLARSKIYQLKKEIHGNEAAFLEYLYSFSSRDHNAPFYVCSFSENGNLLSQWRGYCPNGSGYSIGFNFNAKSLTNSLKKQNFKLLPCIYQHNLQLIMVNEIIHKFLDKFRSMQNQKEDQDSTIKDLSHKCFSELASIAPILKDRSFHEEREWRLISPNIGFNRPQIKYREGKSMIIPYIEFMLSESDEQLFIPEILIGPTPHPNLSCTSVISLLHSFNVKWEQVSISRIPYRDW